MISRWLNVAFLTSKRQLCDSDDGIRFHRNLSSTLLHSAGLQRSQRYEHVHVSQRQLSSSSFAFVIMKEPTPSSIILRLVTSPTLGQSSGASSNELPGPVPPGLSPWLWGGLTANIYRIRRLNLPNHYYWMLPFAIVCSLLLLDRYGSYWRVTSSIILGVSFLSTLVLLWWGHWCMRYRVKRLLEELQEPLRQQGWSLELIDESQWWFGVYTCELERLAGSLTELPVAAAASGRRLRAPYTSAFARDGYTWPTLAEDVWTWGAVLNSVEQAQDETRTGGKSIVWAGLALLCALYCFTLSPQHSGLGIVFFAVFLGMLPWGRHDYGDALQRGVDRINPLLGERCGMRAMLEYDSSGWREEAYIRLEQNV